MDRKLRTSRKLPPTFIDDLRERVSLVALISEKIPLKKAGHNFMACCPFHKEKSASFTVHPQKHFYHCFGCGAHGDAIDFLQHSEQLTFMEAVERLALQVGMVIPEEVLGEKDDSRNVLYEVLQDASRFYTNTLRSSPKAIDYLKKRGITGQTAKDFALGYAPSQWDGCLRAVGTTAERKAALATTGLIITNESNKQWDRFRDRVMFPIRDRRGRTVAFGGRIIDEGEPKYLNSPAGPTFNKSQILYGEYENLLMHTNGPLIVVEGYMDVIALISKGFKAVASMGTALTTEHLERLFKHHETFVLCFDGDTAGQRAAARALECALPLMEDGRSIQFLTLPQDEDPDTYIAHRGPEGFKMLLDKALPFSGFFFKIKCTDQTINSIDDRARLAKLAKASLALLPKGAFKSLMYDALETWLFERPPVERKQVYTSQPSGFQHTRFPAKKYGYPDRTPPDGPMVPLLTPEEVLLYLLLHEPEFMKTTQASILEQSSLNTPVFLGLKTLIKSLLNDSSKKGLSTLQDRLETVKPYLSASTIDGMSNPPTIEASGWAQEWEGAFERLEQRWVKERTNDLLVYAQKSELTPSQREELQQLLALKQLIQSSSQ